MKDIKAIKMDLENQKITTRIHKNFKISFMIFLYLYLISLFAIFIIPIDILDRSEIYANFVNFMKQIFLNIEVFGSVSKIPQIIKFYASVVWIFATMLCLIILFFAIFILYKERLKDSKTKLLSFWTAIGICLLGLYGMRIYWTGYIVTNIFDFGIRVIKITMSSKFEIFFYVSIFQSAFIVGFIMFIFPIIDLCVKWKKLK